MRSPVRLRQQADGRPAPSRRIDWRRQWDAVLRMMLMPYAPAALLLAIAYLQRAAPVSDLVGDTNAVAGVPFYVGLVSNLGVLLWAGAAAVCLFTWAVLPGKRGAESKRFLLASGVFSAVLTLDDAIQLHEVVLPDYLGVSQNLVYLAYVLSALAYLFAFRRTILKTEFSLLAVALALFALSTVLDELSDLELMASVRGIQATEEAAKLMGILGWLTYFARTCKDTLDRLLASPTA